MKLLKILRIPGLSLFLNVCFYLMFLALQILMWQFSACLVLFVGLGSAAYVYLGRDRLRLAGLLLTGAIIGTLGGLMTGGAVRTLLAQTREVPAERIAQQADARVLHVADAVAQLHLASSFVDGSTASDPLRNPHANRTHALLLVPITGPDWHAAVPVAAFAVVTDGPNNDRTLELLARSCSWLVASDDQARFREKLKEVALTRGLKLDPAVRVFSAPADPRALAIADLQVALGVMFILWILQMFAFRRALD